MAFCWVLTEGNGCLDEWRAEENPMELWACEWMKMEKKYE